MHFSPLFALAAVVSATNLFVADYSGDITTLSLTQTGDTYDLKSVATNKGCGANPSWLTLDSSRRMLLCTNEAFKAPNGSLTSFSINADGSLVQIAKVTTAGGPASAVIYGDPKASTRGIAVAHYTGSALTTFTLSSTGKLTKNEEFFFTISKPGPDTARQSASHPHQAIVDPTGKFILVPDLGLDLVHIFSLDPKTLKLKQLEPLSVDPGSGPRHLTFWIPNSIPGSRTFMYLLGELSATLTSYGVHYSPNKIAFQKIKQTTSTGNYSPPHRRAPAELQVARNNGYLYVSNRNDSGMKLDDGSESDTLSIFRLPESGEVTSTVRNVPAGGKYPRHFDVNRDGHLVAVGLQYSKSVAILKNNLTYNWAVDQVASFQIGGNVSTVLWDEVVKPAGGKI